MNIEHAIILSAGLGTRLKWLTQHTPKALMQVRGEAAVVHVIRQLSRHGVRHIVLNIHHHAQQIVDHLERGERLGVRLSYSFEEELLDSGGGVRTALTQLPEGVPFFVHNADVISDIHLAHLAHSAATHAAALALVHNPKHHPEGDFSCQHGLVHRQGSPRYTFAGVSAWSYDVWRDYPERQKFSLLRVIEKQIEQQQCAGMLHRGQWLDVGRPRDLIRANRSHPTWSAL